MVIDSHVHLSSLKEDNNFKKAKKKLLSKMDENGIDRGIVIPDSYLGSDIGDLNTVLDVVKGEQRLFALGAMDVKNQGSDWLDKLDRLLKKGKIKGIKIFPGHEPIYPTDERFNPLYELLSKYNYPLVVHTGPNIDHPETAKYNDPKYLVELTEKFPNLKIVIAHYFWPRVEYCYETTKGYKNIYYDTSALADKEVVEATGKEKIKEVLKKTIAADPGSVLFGSDVPMCSFANHLNLVDSLDLSEPKRKQVLWKNTSELFKLGLDEKQ